MSKVAEAPAGAESCGAGMHVIYVYCMSSVCLRVSSSDLQSLTIASSPGAHPCPEPSCAVEWAAAAITVLPLPSLSMLCAFWLRPLSCTSICHCAADRLACSAMLVPSSCRKVNSATAVPNSTTAPTGTHRYMSPTICKQIELLAAIAICTGALTCAYSEWTDSS